MVTQAGAEPFIRILPDINLVKLGAQSLIDRGRSAHHRLRAAAPALDSKRDVVATRQQRPPADARKNCCVTAYWTSASPTGCAAR